MTMVRFLGPVSILELADRSRSEPWPLQTLVKTKLEGNVLLEPAAAMNQMLVLKWLINVDSSMLPRIISLCTFSTLHTTHSLCTLCTLKPRVPCIPCGKCPIPLFQPKNRYYIMNFTKLTSVTRVPLMESINSCYLISFPKITSVTWVPLVEPIDRYYMVIFPKITSVTWVPLVEPINS